jgi:fused signal recognition particle receptor
MADLFSKWKNALNRTSKAAFGRLATVFGATDIDEFTWDELEALLVQADIGIETTQDIIQALQKRVEQEGIIHSQDLREVMKDELIRRLDVPPSLDFSALKPYVILVVGVNGAGKTTTIAKLAKKYKEQGKSVMLVAADTYRAAAVDQLQVWADRLNIPIIAGQMMAIPGAVTLMDCRLPSAAARISSWLNTAGRLHTRFNLMEELKKVFRVTGKSAGRRSARRMAGFRRNNRAKRLITGARL